jgi:hypothetical protein
MVGHAAAAPSNVMNSRRFIVAPDAEETTIVAEQLIALEGPMSALGQQQTWRHSKGISALPQKAVPAQHLRYIKAR